MSSWLGDVWALGLGELRTESALGDPLVAEVEVLTSGKEIVDASCFRLRPPQGEGDLPWLRRGSLSVRRGEKTILDIRSPLPLRDPVLQIGIAIGCGHEVQRDYTLLLSPPDKDADVPARAATPPVTAAAAPAAPRAAARRPSVAAAEPMMQPRLAARQPARRVKPALAGDRLVLSGGAVGVGELSMRFATELSGWREQNTSSQEAKREVLRLEYRVLEAMNEQAASQLAAAEKLRNMESALADLQQRAGQLAQQVDRAGIPAAPAAPVAPVAPVAPAATPPAPSAPPAPAPAAKPGEAASEQSESLMEWTFYGALLAAALGIAGWLGWRQYRERRDVEELVDLDEPVPEPTIEPPRSPQPEPFGEVDFQVEPAAPDAPTQVDVPLDADEVARPVAASMEDVDIPVEPDSARSADGATVVGEHFEANPVMELAEIMLSFGRVKGAAQALQEYIDHNPEEALQPWIRLMDVYRMAGMREEFDRLAQDLNRHFNVEVQQWAPSPAAKPLDRPLDFILDGGEAAPSKATSLEDLEHIRNKLTACWGTSECLDYLNQLLRDNRGGKRNGFPLPVVEEILFLVELLGTRKAIEKETVGG